MKALLELIWTFLRIGCMMFGGGYVMLPLLQREVVEKKGWITQEALLECFALSQCTPGVIAVNCATQVGYVRKGVLGGICATFAVVTPSLVIICLLAGILEQIAHYPLVLSAFAGIRAAVAALVVATLWKLYKKGVKGAFGNGVFVACLALSLLGISPVILVLIAVLLGVILEWRRKV